jgi:hypothetical protein
MVGTLNGPDPAFKLAMYEAYQPMFQLVATEILAAGIERGLYRPLEPIATANLLMTIYLGVASQVNERGEPWFSAEQVTGLLLEGLRTQQSHREDQDERLA